jgi:hypothetical protein
VPLGVRSKNETKSSHTISVDIAVYIAFGMVDDVMVARLQHFVVGGGFIGENGRTGF